MADPKSAIENPTTIIVSAISLGRERGFSQSRSESGAAGTVGEEDTEEQHDFECAVSLANQRDRFQKSCPRSGDWCVMLKKERAACVTFTVRKQPIGKAWAAYRSSIHQRRNVQVDFTFELLGLRVLARSLIVSALLGPVAAIIDITPTAAAVLAVIQE